MRFIHEFHRSEVGSRCRQKKGVPSKIHEVSIWTPSEVITCKMVQMEENIVRYGKVYTQQQSAKPWPPDPLSPTYAFCILACHKPRNLNAFCISMHESVSASQTVEVVVHLQSAFDFQGPWCSSPPSTSAPPHC